MVWQSLRCESHLSSKVIPSRQMFEAKQTVPLAGSASAGVIVHNLTQRHKMRSITHRERSVFVQHLWCFLSSSMWFSVSPCLLPNGLIECRRTFKRLFTVFSLCVWVWDHYSLSDFFSGQNSSVYNKIVSVMLLIPYMLPKVTIIQKPN